MIRNSPETWRVAGQVVSTGTRVNPAGVAVGASMLAADQLGRARMNITYTATGPNNQIYIGRASGWFSTPEQVMARRWSSHHVSAQGFGNPLLDVYTAGDYGSPSYMAIRGREQQLIDFHGGVRGPNNPGSPVANRIRGVSARNPLGRMYHNNSTSRWGELHGYTGNW